MDNSLLGRLTAIRDLREAAGFEMYALVNESASGKIIIGLDELIHAVKDLENMRALFAAQTSADSADVARTGETR